MNSADVERTFDELGDNAAIKPTALACLSGNWQNPVLVTLLFAVISIGSSQLPFSGELISFLINGPLTLGIAGFFLKISRKESCEVKEMFAGFSDFGRALIAYLLMMIFILLWTLLLIIPGIIAGFSYALTFYLLADNPGMSGMEALRRSKELMNGYKAELFMLL